MYEILYHRTIAKAFRSDDAFVTSRSGQNKLLCNTKGWFLCVRCKDGSYSWIAHKNLKDSNPVEVDEYAAAKQLCMNSLFLVGPLLP